MQNPEHTLLEQIIELIQNRDNETLLQLFQDQKKKNSPIVIAKNFIPEILHQAAQAKNLEALVILSEYGVDFDTTIDDKPLFDYLLEHHTRRITAEISSGEIALLLNSLAQLHWNPEAISATELKNKKKYEVFFKSRPEFLKTQEFLGKYYLFACAYGLVESIKNFLAFTVPGKAQYQTNNPSSSSGSSPYKQLNVNNAVFREDTVTALHSQNQQQNLLTDLDQHMPSNPSPQLTPEQRQQIGEQQKNTPEARKSEEYNQWRKQHSTGDKVIPINYQAPVTGNTGLHIAVYTNQNKVIKFLLDCEIDASIKNNDGLTAENMTIKIKATNTIQSKEEEKLEAPKSEAAVFKPHTVLDDRVKNSFINLLKPICKFKDKYTNFKAALDGFKRRHHDNFNQLIEYATKNLIGSDLNNFNTYYEQYRKEKSEKATAEKITEGVNQLNLS